MRKYEIVKWEPPINFLAIKVDEYAQQECNKFILKVRLVYKTMSILGPHTIEIALGEVFHRFVDDPTNFSNGFTILSEQILTNNPKIFEPVWENIQ